MSRSGDEGSGDMLELCFHTAREDALRRHIQPRAAAAPPPITILCLHPLYRFSMLQSCYGPHTKRRQQQALNFSGLSYRTMCVCVCVKLTGSGHPSRGQHRLVGSLGDGRHGGGGLGELGLGLESNQASTLSGLGRTTRKASLAVLSFKNHTAMV